MHRQGPGRSSLPGDAFAHHPSPSPGALFAGERSHQETKLRIYGRGRGKTCSRRRRIRLFRRRPFRLLFDPFGWTGQLSWGVRAHSRLGWKWDLLRRPPHGPSRGMLRSMGREPEATPFLDVVSLFCGDGVGVDRAVIGAVGSPPSARIFSHVQRGRIVLVRCRCGWWCVIFDLCDDSVQRMDSASSLLGRTGC